MGSLDGKVCLVTRHATREDDVAAAVAAAAGLKPATDQSSFSTASTLVVDGGMST